MYEYAQIDFIYRGILAPELRCIECSNLHQFSFNSPCFVRFASNLIQFSYQFIIESFTSDIRVVNLINGCNILHENALSLLSKKHT